jgi:hypothetical protein
MTTTIFFERSMIFSPQTVIAHSAYPENAVPRPVASHDMTLTKIPRRRPR